MTEKKGNRIIASWFSRTFNRREFLETNLKGAFILAAGSSGLLLPGTGMSKTSPDVVVAKGSPVEALKAAMKAAGGMTSYVKPGNKVLIKPNMSWASEPERASNTNPLIVKELAIMCKEAGASSVLITDYTLQAPESCLSSSGIGDACKDIPGVSVKTANSDILYKDTEFSNAVTMKKNGVHKEALAADVLIAVPIAKTHFATGVSLALKGMMGLVWDRRSMHMANLSSAIVDICTGDLKADLTVIDASRVLSSNGPGGPGDVLVENTVIISKDMVAADAYAVSAFKWYGKDYQPKQVEHVKMAAERGLGRMDLENMTIKQLTI